MFCYLDIKFFYLVLKLITKNVGTKIQKKNLTIRKRKIEKQAEP